MSAATAASQIIDLSDRRSTSATANPHPHTQMDNAYFDRAMAHLGYGELKALLYVIRHTRGYHTNSAALSLSNFVSGRRRRDGSILDEGTGLSKPTVIAALAALQMKGLILRHDTSEQSMHVFELLPEEMWHLDADATQAQSASQPASERVASKAALPPAEHRASKAALPPAGQSALPAAPKGGQSALPRIKKRETQKKLETETRMRAAGQQAALAVSVIAERAAPAPAPAPAPVSEMTATTTVSPSKLDTLHEDYRAIIRALRRSKGWHRDDEAERLLVEQLCEDKRLDPAWLLDEAASFAHYEMHHTPRNFLLWCTGRVGRIRYTQWQNERYEEERKLKRAIEKGQPANGMVLSDAARSAKPASVQVADLAAAMMASIRAGTPLQQPQQSRQKGTVAR